MSTIVEQAIEFFDQACRAEEQGPMVLAEVYYLKSSALFQQAGGVHFLDAAHVLNALAFLRETRGDYEGALYSAEKSAHIMETKCVEFSSRQANEVRLQAWGLIGNIYRHMARYTEAEEIFLRTLEYAIETFGEVDEETSAARDHLASLYRSTGEFDKAETLYRETPKILIGQ